MVQSQAKTVGQHLGERIASPPVEDYLARFEANRRQTRTRATRAGQ